MPVRFFSEKIKFSLKDKRKLREWLKKTAEAENKKIAELNYIFCSDEYLLELNKQYLKHDTLTDIITFDYSNEKKPNVSLTVSGDIYISIPRVKENAKKFGVDFRDELHRVMVHGLLHLFGCKDKKAVDKTKMKQKEDFYLEKLRTL